MFEIYNITSVIMKRIFLVKIKMSGDIYKRKPPKK